MKIIAIKKISFLIIICISITLSSEIKAITNFENNLIVSKKYNNEYTPFNLINNQSIQGSNNSIDSLKKKNKYLPSFEFQVAFGLGGESKVSLFLPRTNFILKHNIGRTSLYYGVGAGLHVNFLTGYSTLSGIIGIEQGILDFETSLSDLAIPKEYFGILDSEGNFHQNLLNFKFGIRTKKIKVRGSISKVLFDGFPIDETRSTFIDIGMKENIILGIEVLFIVNKY